MTPDLFPLLGIEPILGRQFLPEEAAAPGLESVVMLTHGLWQRRYGADPAIIGKAVMVNDRPRTVIGVLPAGFAFPLIDQLYMPLRWDESPRASRNVNAVALLQAGDHHRSGPIRNRGYCPPARSRPTRNRTAASACRSFPFDSPTSAPSRGG